MINTKTYLITIGILLVILAGFFMFYKSTVSDLEAKVIDLQTEQQTEIRKVRDSAIQMQFDLSKNKNKIIDSLKLLKNEIIYKPYVKYKYLDMDYERAYDILSNSSYSEGKE